MGSHRRLFLFLRGQQRRRRFNNTRISWKAFKKSHPSLRFCTRRSPFLLRLRITHEHNIVRNKLIVLFRSQPLSVQLNSREHYRLYGTSCEWSLIQIISCVRMRESSRSKKLKIRNNMWQNKGTHLLHPPLAGVLLYWDRCLPRLWVTRINHIHTLLYQHLT